MTRIIPARAGFTPSTTTSPPTTRDHPRSRGVYCRARHARDSGAGSSPLARGLLPDQRDVPDEDRIIPARAGFTRGSDHDLGVHRDHPRSRGVYRRGSPPPRGAKGSSPLARGLRRVRVQGLDNPRIIPARAGFTAISSPPSSPGTDHPRSRGVYGGREEHIATLCGSSPLARGLLTRFAPPRTTSGIIPARAGFTPGGRRFARSYQDHPRSRGVYSSSPIDPPWEKGSSPLARGLLAPLLRGQADADHPRSRGVYLSNEY